MYQTSDWSIMLRATMDISARTNSLPERPQRTIWVTSVRMRREDRTSILEFVLPTRDHAREDQE